MSARRPAKTHDPREFAGYVLMHCLGRGGMGEVWSVVRRGPYKIDHPLAVKAMSPELSGNEDFCQIFISEGRITMQLSSANIVPVFEMGRHDGLLFMVMQRVDGVNLAEFQRRTRNVYNTLPLDVVLYIIGELLGALFVAHEHIVKGQTAGIIHRDIKPANVLVSSSGEVRLTDFGIARPATPHSFRPMPIGTLRYISREQAEGQADRASDLFAVGAILHELLSGRQFRETAQTEQQLLAAIFSYTEVPPLGRVIPEDIERLRHGLLHPDPKRRFQSAAEAMERLSECNAYNFARLRLARIYETAIGVRSSGFTDSHLEAKPSFLLNRERSGTGSDAAVSNDFVISRDGTGRETSFEVKEEQHTLLVSRVLPRVRAEGPSDEERLEDPTLLYKPVIARIRRDVVGPHPIAPEAASTVATMAPSDAGEADEARAAPTAASTATHDAGEADQVRAITPTLQLLLPVGQQPQEASRPDRTEAVAEIPQDSPRGKKPAPTVRLRVEPEPEPRAPAVDSPSDSRNTASTSGTIDASHRPPDIDRMAKPPAATKGPATSTPSRVYFIVLAALLSALVAVSTAWLLESMSKDSQDAEAKP